MTELGVMLCLGIGFILLAVIYVQWFDTHARAIADTVALSACVRAALLVVCLFWIYPFYANRMGSDADVYYGMAMEDVQSVAMGQWYALPREFGSATMGLVTAAIYLPTRLPIEGMHALSALLSLVAATLLWGAIVLWRGAGAARPFLLAMMFWPSLLYWTGTFGKDCLCFLLMALVTFSYSRICHSKASLSPLPGLAGGLVLLVFIRPHFAFVVCAAICVAEFYSIVMLRTGIRRPGRTLFLATMAASAAACWASSSIMISGEVSDSPSERLLQTRELTAIGDSAFEKKQTTTFTEMLLDVPSSTLTTFLRPFPWEAHNAVSGLESVENVSMLLLAVWKFRSLWRNARSSTGSTFGAFCLAMLFLLVVYNSAGSNFGMISRSRVHTFPFLIAVVATPAACIDHRARHRRLAPVRRLTAMGDPLW